MIVKGDKVPPYTYYHQVHDDYRSAVDAMYYWITETMNDKNQILRAVSFDIHQDFDTKKTRYSVLVRGSPIVENAA